jgi:gas vesicle protein
MKSILIILGLVAIAAGAVIYLVKKGKIADSDGDLIPDVVEDAVDDVKATAKEVKKRAKNVAKEAKEVADAVKNVVKESKDVVNAAKGKGKKVTKSSLRSKTKAQLIDVAKNEFDVEFDSSLTKTNLINKVYELYNKK